MKFTLCRNYWLRYREVTYICMSGITTHKKCNEIDHPCTMYPEQIVILNANQLIRRYIYIASFAFKKHKGILNLYTKQKTKVRCSVTHRLQIQLVSSFTTRIHIFFENT